MFTTCPGMEIVFPAAAPVPSVFSLWIVQWAAVFSPLLMPKGVVHFWKTQSAQLCLSLFFHSDDKAEVAGVKFLFRVPFTFVLHWDRAQEQRAKLPAPDFKSLEIS